MQSRNLIIKGVSWIALARVIVSLLGLASMLILARLLVPEDFGLVALAASIAVLISAVTDLSLTQALIQREDIEDYHYDTAWTLNNIRALSLSLIIFSIAGLVSTAYGDPRLYGIMIFFAGATLIEGLPSPKMVQFQRRLDFWQEFVLSVVEKLGGFIVGVSVALAVENYWALILGSAAARCARVFLSYYFAPYFPRFSLRGWRDLFSFSFWLILAKLIQMINWRSDPLILGSSVGPATLGLYSVSENLAGMPIREGLGPIRQTLFPAFSRIKDDASRLRSAYARTQAVICLLALPIGIGFAAVAEPVIDLMLGEKWLPAVPIIVALSIIMAMDACEGYQSLAMALGKTRSMFGRELRIFLIRVPLFVIGLYGGAQFGGELSMIMGALIGRGISSLINVSWNMSLIKEMIGVSIFDQFQLILRPTVAAVIMLVLIDIFSNTYSSLGLHASGLVFVVFLVLSGLLVYCVSVYLMWRLAGRPDSAEVEIVRIVGEYKGRLIKFVRSHRRNY